MAVKKEHRALLVVNSLVTGGRKDLAWLYQFIEVSGAILAETLLSPHYGTYRSLVGPQVTQAKFVSSLKSLGDEPTIQAIDVIINLHGSPNILYFYDGAVGMTELKKSLLSLNLKNKFRMLYSTACYGSTHADEFVAAGFNAASGAIGVNANSATEYPTVLTMWAAGMAFKDAISAGENIITRAPADAAAAAMGFQDVNSDKRILGNGRITIQAAG